MKKERFLVFYLLVTLIVVLVFSCQTMRPDREVKISAPHSAQEDLSYEEVFEDLEDILKKDGKKFWNHGLYGPIILVEPATRKLYANENNNSGTLEKIGEIYTGILPQDVNIANTSVDWEGRRWAMILLPLPKDSIERRNLLIHESFHRIQPAIGFGDLEEANNEHLNTREGRTLLKLELEALKDALASQSERVQKGHLENAFFFRKERQKNATIREAENSLELNEGLAEYSGLMLSGSEREEKANHLLKSIDELYKNPSFVRSFAYHTVAIYGFILSEKHPNWHKSIDRKTNLTDFFIRAFDVEVPRTDDFSEIAKLNNYNFEKIQKEERVREERRLEKLQEYKARFIEGQTLVLPFQNMNITFDPRELFPLPDYGTVYPHLQISDVWGILTVENGALLSSDWSKVTVSEPLTIDASVIKGDGWKLELNDNYEIIKDNGVYRLDVVQK